MQNSSKDNIKFDREIFKKRAFCIASFYIYTSSMDSPLENLERKKYSGKDHSQDLAWIVLSTLNAWITSFNLVLVWNEKFAELFEI